MMRGIFRQASSPALCAAAFALTALLTLTPVGAPVQASDYRAGGMTAVRGGAQHLPLGIGKSVVVDLPREVKDVLVADPKIANAVVRSAQRAYIIGAAVGQTSIFFFDTNGEQIAAYDIAVTRDLNGVRAALKQSLPHANINIEGVGDGVVLTGVVNSPIDAQHANDLAGRLVGDASKVVNSIVVRGRDQVMLKVTVAEVQRDVIKQLGIDLNGSLNFGTSVVNFNNTNAFPLNNPPAGNIAGTFAKGAASNVTATMRAMERAGIVRTLAEPNLTAISGESASFLVGGEFPVVIPGSLSSPPTIQFKKFGISLNFVPVVLTEGRISIRVGTEVSELSSEGAVQVSGLSIPSLRTRRAETTLEIPSGGAMAMAGLIQEQTKQAINGLPGMLELPVLGTLFKSRDYLNRQTELAVIVTPYIVRAVAQKDLSRPDDGFVDSSDPSAVIAGTINRIYGAPGGGPATRPRRAGLFGFITD